MDTDVPFEICIPTLNRKELLTRLLDTIPENIPIRISDNGGYIAQSGGLSKARKNCVTKPTTEILPMFKNWRKAIEIGM